MFSWVSGLLDLGIQKPLEANDLWEVATRDAADAVSTRFQECLLKSTGTVDKSVASVASALWKSHFRSFCIAGLIKLVHDAVMFLGPVILEILLKHLKSESDIRLRLLLASSLAVTSIVEMLTVNIYFHILFRICLHMKTELVDMLYSKSLRMTSSAKTDVGTGTIVNLQSNDAAKLWKLPQYLHMIWSGPLQILVVMVLLMRILHPIPALVGLGVTVALIPLSAIVAQVLSCIRSQAIRLTDARIKLCGEVITGIKAIKLYAWETAYQERIIDLRKKELTALRTAALVGIWNNMLWIGGPVLISMAAFGTYYALGYPLTPDVAFPALSLFNLLRFPVMMFPSQLMDLVNAKVALKRIQQFMEQDEMHQAPVVEDGQAAIEIENGFFSWHLSEEPILRNISVSIPQGQLVFVIGDVASGKSSLLSAILGEMISPISPINNNNNKQQHVIVRGRVAYTQQDTWIQNGTLRENILLGSDDFNASWYEKVVDACALRPDIAALPAGDETEIGEKGVNLSGGQKHRVALARACYADADIYLLDDPFAAVDAHVARHLFERCILGILSKKTVVLVTHQVQWLPAADLILVMKNGRIVEQGSYENLSSKLKIMSDASTSASASGRTSESDPIGDEASSTDITVDNKNVISNNNSNGDKDVFGNLNPIPKLNGDAATKPSINAQHGKLTRAEERAVGGVDTYVYWRYFSSWGPWLWVPIVVLTLATTERGIQAVQSWWLSVWTEASTKDDGHYVKVYFILGSISLAFQVAKAIILVLGSMVAAKRLHASLLSTILRLPMSFFDSQPNGRLLNRFTRDTESVDTALQASVSSFLNCAISVVWSLIVVAFVSPWMILTVAPLSFAYMAIQKRYIATSRELKRLDSLALSPIFSHFGETLSGLVTVRAFRVQQRFIDKNFRLLDASNRCYWPAQCVNRWLSVRLELLGIGIVFATTVLVVVVLPTSAGLAGLALTSALSLTGLMNWMVRQSTELEVNMNSVERMLEYEPYEQEAPEIVEGHRPLPEWPSRGTISVQDLVVRYRPDLPPVLHGISFDVNENEKIGVAGRTGCGKSTLMLAIYRIVEPCGGRILIDGINIATIGLKDLRSRLALVPQDPVIFSGTVRSNIDPFGEFGIDGDDTRLRWALEKAGLPNMQLDAPMKEGGSSLSAGQRQLLCMARALLRPARILILDEATSSIDMATDSFIQSMISTAFADRTVLTIAHRLDTIMGSDRVLVLDAGRVLEFDSPATLLESPGGAFSRLVEETKGLH